MPYYKDLAYFRAVNALSHPDFDVEFQVGSQARKAGIYRCTECGHEIAIAAGHTLPPDGAHEHPTHNALTRGFASTLLGGSSTKWKLVAQAKHVHDRP